MPNIPPTGFVAHPTFAMHPHAEHPNDVNRAPKPAPMHAVYVPDVVQETLDRHDFAGVERASHVELGRLATLPYGGAQLAQGLRDLAARGESTAIGAQYPHVHRLLEANGLPPDVATAYAGMTVRAAGVLATLTHLSFMKTNWGQHQQALSYAEASGEAAWQSALFADVTGLVHSNSLFDMLRNVQQPLELPEIPVEFLQAPLELPEIPVEFLQAPVELPQAPVVPSQPHARVRTFDPVRDITPQPVNPVRDITPQPVNARPAYADASTQTDKPEAAFLTDVGIAALTPQSLNTRPATSGSGAVSEAPQSNDSWLDMQFLMDPPSPELFAITQSPLLANLPMSPLFFHEEFSFFPGLPAPSPLPATAAQTRAATPDSNIDAPNSPDPSVSRLPSPQPAAEASPQVSSEAPTSVAKRNRSRSKRPSEHKSPSTPGAARGRAIKEGPGIVRNFACGGGCGKAGCNKSYIRQEHLKRHRKIVKDIACLFPGCEKMFPRQDNMRQHLRVHEKVVTLQVPALFDPANAERFSGFLAQPQG